MVDRDQDFTSDFTEGCTPYKNVAKNVNIKLKIEHHRKKSIRQNTALSGSQTCGKEGPSTTCTEKKCDSTDTKLCLICGLSVSLELYKYHMKGCLKNSFCWSNKPTKQGAATEDPDQRANLNRNLPDGPNADEETNKKTEVRTKAINKVLDCPLCGQVLKTTRSRKIHLKHCAKKLDVPSSVLLQCIERQAEEYKLKLEAGVLPKEEKLSTKGRKRLPQNRDDHSGIANQHARFGDLHIKFDEETQLALALSKSLLEETTKKNIDRYPLDPASAGGVPQTSSDDLKKDVFSVLMSQKHDVPKSRKKSKVKAALQKIYLLQTETTENRLRKLQNKIVSLLSSEGDEAVCLTPRLQQTALKNEFNFTAEEQDAKLWFLDSWPEADKRVFYVQNLQPHVIPSDVEAGSKLKRMSNIPGWEPLGTQGNVNLQSKPRSTALTLLNASTIDNSTLVANTQTAVLLAEMASEASGMNVEDNSSVSEQDNNRCTYDETKNLTTSATIQESDADQEFCHPDKFETKQAAARKRLIEDLTRLMTSKQNADLSILCGSGIEVKAYSLFVELRCPTLFKEATNGKLALHNYGEDCINTLLKYIYTGDISVSRTVAAELEELAERYGITELASACCETLRKSSLNVDGLIDVTSSQSHEIIDKTLQNLLHDAWGSDSDSDDESACGRKEWNKPSASPEEKELELDEIYFISQKQSHFSDTEEDTDGEISSSDGKQSSLTLNAALLQKLDESFLLDTTKWSDNSDQNSDKESEPSCALGVETNDSQEVDNSSYHCHVSDHDTRTIACGEQSQDHSISDDEMNCFQERTIDKNHNQNSQQVAYTPHHVYDKDTAENRDTTPDLFSIEDSDIEDQPNKRSRTASLNECLTDLYQAVKDNHKTNITSEEKDDLVTSTKGRHDTSEESCSDLSLNMNDNIISQSGHMLDDCESEFDLSGKCSSVNISQPLQYLPNESVQSENLSGKKRKRSIPSQDSAESESHESTNKKIRIKKSKAKEMPESADDKPVESESTDSMSLQTQKLKPACRNEEYADVVDLTACGEEDEDDFMISDHHVADGYSGTPVDQSPTKTPEEEPKTPVAQPDVLNTSSSSEMDVLNLDGSKPVSVLPDSTDIQCIDNGEPCSYSAADTWDGFDDCGGCIQFDIDMTQEDNIPDANENETAFVGSSKYTGDSEDQENNTDMSSAPPAYIHKTQSIRTSVSKEKPAEKSLDTCSSGQLESLASGVDGKPVYEELVFKTPKRNLLSRNKHLTDIDPKTPEKSKQCWQPPSPFTPMSDYDSMTTPELKKACHEVGVKPLPKKKMVAILKEIYHKTHSYETDTDYEGTPCRPPPVKTTDVDSHKYHKTKETRISNVLQMKSKVHNISKMSSAAVINSPLDDGNTSTSDTDDDLINSSQEKGISCSQDSESHTEMPEESVIAVEDVKEEKKLSKRDLAFKRQHIWDFILANQDLYLKILHFEPLDMNDFHAQLKLNGLNVSTRVVMDFLDDQNVLFTMKNNSTNQWKKKSKKGFTASQQRTQSQQ